MAYTAYPSVSFRISFCKIEGKLQILGWSIPDVYKAATLLFSVIRGIKCAAALGIAVFFVPIAYAVLAGIYHGAVAHLHYTVVKMVIYVFVRIGKLHNVVIHGNVIIGPAF